MPDESGTLTQEEHAKIALWIGQRWKAPPECPVSGDKQWSIAPNIVNLHIAKGGASLTVGAPVYPQVLIICTGCGYTMMFNAVHMGLVKGEEPKEEPKNG